MLFHFQRPLTMSFLFVVVVDVVKFVVVDIDVVVPIPVSYLASVWSIKVYLKLLEATVVIVVIVMLKEFY